MKPGWAIFLSAQLHWKLKKFENGRSLGAGWAGQNAQRVSRKLTSSQWPVPFVRLTHSLPSRLSRHCKSSWNEKKKGNGACWPRQPQLRSDHAPTNEESDWSVLTSNLSFFLKFGFESRFGGTIHFPEIHMYPWHQYMYPWHQLLCRRTMVVNPRYRQIYTSNSGEFDLFFHQNWRLGMAKFVSDQFVWFVAQLLWTRRLHQVKEILNGNDPKCHWTQD